MRECLPGILKVGAVEKLYLGMRGGYGIGKGLHRFLNLQLAVDGVNRPTFCKFPTEVDRVELLQAIEILDVTEKARESIAAVPIWKALE